MPTIIAAAGRTATGNMRDLPKCCKSLYIYIIPYFYYQTLKHRNTKSFSIPYIKTKLFALEK